MKLIMLTLLIIVCLFATGLYVYRGIWLDRGVIALKSKDYESAIYYLKPLAVIGDSTAQREVGWMYAFGWGVTQNDSEALLWFRRAAFEHQGGSDRAAASAYYVAERYRELYISDCENPGEYAKKALSWYKYSAEGGFVKAADFLSEAYTEGLLGLTPNRMEALHWSALAKQIEAIERMK